MTTYQWISALGTILDAAALVMTTISGLPRGEAELAKRLGAHLVRGPRQPRIPGRPAGATGPARFRGRLRSPRARGLFPRAGEDAAWTAFQAKRASYAPRLEAMAAYWATPATSWLGVQAPLRSPAHVDPDEVVAGARSQYPRQAG